jgi:hypothetical protein
MPIYSFLGLFWIVWVRREEVKVAKLRSKCGGGRVRFLLVRVFNKATSKINPNPRNRGQGQIDHLSRSE